MAVRLKKLAKVLRGYDIQLEKPSKGSHWKLRAKGRRPYPVPAHQGERAEIADEYVHGLCKHFAIDRDSLLAKIRGGK